MDIEGGVLNHLVDTVTIGKPLLLYGKKDHFEILDHPQHVLNSLSLPAAMPSGNLVDIAFELYRAFRPRCDETALIGPLIYQETVMGPDTLTCCIA
ncbi:hypothetical protein OUZ56_029594 [Daphnia magna]|uniref:Uncharacterized protein n=1 Tax=Daphnia magna TaxID=35525 RepID=A0ABR0B7P8_9CRUS|nr:hypothetical protein OUZ56_029594 [Daphnia magna]